MTAVRDSLCNLEPVQIPRPQISGLQFIPTRGRLGFYKSIHRDGEKYGVGIKTIGPRRPPLADVCFVKENDVQSTSASSTDPKNSAQTQKSSSDVLQQVFL
ncbi:unnamed protein product [Gongylonema pulchrum]|uniref:CAP-Gly domain-containing protein n=1 Tax=Gongylonema pulchrum TaxID=637853 RepID=A0A183EXV3_9BILA|nr:unnamed protein product [Gongylonema pulchrum]